MPRIKFVMYGPISSSSSSPSLGTISTSGQMTRLILPFLACPLHLTDVVEKDNDRTRSGTNVRYATV